MVLFFHFQTISNNDQEDGDMFTDAVQREQEEQHQEVSEHSFS